MTLGAARFWSCRPPERKETWASRVSPVWHLATSVDHRLFPPRRAPSTSLALALSHLLANISHCIFIFVACNSGFVLRGLSASLLSQSLPPPKRRRWRAAARRDQQRPCPALFPSPLHSSQLFCPCRRQSSPCLASAVLTKLAPSRSLLPPSCAARPNFPRH